MVRLRSALPSILLACAFLGVDAKSALGIKGAKVTVTSPDGLQDASYNLKEPEPLPRSVELSESTTFKLAFTVIDLESGSGLSPQQAHLLFEDEQGEEDVTLPIAVKENGKASFTINTAKPHTALLSTHGQFRMSLLLSNPGQTPLQYPLGQLSLPSSILKPLPRKRHDLPPRQGEPAFQAQQELTHTFNPLETTVGWTKTFIGIGLTLSPWLVLGALYPQVSPSLAFTAPPMTSYLFLLTLASIEVLCAVYWVGLRLYQFLPWFIGLSTVSAYVGKVALGELRQKRLKAGGAP